MPKITYIEASGLRHDIDVPAGHTVMEGGRDAGVEGIVADRDRGPGEADAALAGGLRRASPAASRRMEDPV